MTRTQRGSYCWSCCGYNHVLHAHLIPKRNISLWPFAGVHLTPTRSHGRHFVSFLFMSSIDTRFFVLNPTAPQPPPDHRNKSYEQLLHQLYNLGEPIRGIPDDVCCLLQSLAVCHGGVWRPCERSSIAYEAKWVGRPCEGASIVQPKWFIWVYRRYQSHSFSGSLTSYLFRFRFLHTSDAYPPAMPCTTTVQYARRVNDQPAMELLQDELYPALTPEQNQLVQLIIEDAT